ncbi:MAG: CPBP family intramembrane metalloprotease [Ruminiclostridium sp.]|nr:CPBP family intramembrane metalloprotease [Ruminiclostridium sp.]
MSEELTVRTENEMIPQYKKTVLLVSTLFMLIFVLRYIAVVLIEYVAITLSGELDYQVVYIIELSISGLFLQVLPAVIAAFMFGYLGKNGRGIKCLYTIPKSTTRAIGNFSAVYGFGNIFNILTIIVTYFITSKADITRKLNTVADQSTLGLGGAWFMFFLLVVIAPIFEEFIFRGAIQTALKPYGNGLAIFVSGILFGIYHGNFQQVFYTAAAGIALGYIANVTGSIFPTTIIHAMMNFIGGVMVLLINTEPVQEYIINGSEESIPDSDMIWVAMYGIFMVSVLILILVGLITAIMKIKQIKRYKAPKVWGEVKNSRKVAMLVFTVPTIISAILVVGTFSGVPDEIIYDFLKGVVG